MNSIFVDFQNLYQVLSYSVVCSLDVLVLVFEDWCYLYCDFYLWVQWVMVQFDCGWLLCKGDCILLVWGNYFVFCEVFFVVLGLGIEVVFFSIKFKQVESEVLVGYIVFWVVLFDVIVQDWLKNIFDVCVVLFSEWQVFCFFELLICLLVLVNCDDMVVMMFIFGIIGEFKGVIIIYNNLFCVIDVYM